jgi:hypothetical protein
MGLCLSFGFESKPDCFVVIRARSSLVTYGSSQNAPGVEGECVVRLELDCLVVILERALNITLFVVRNAPVVEGIGIVRLESDCLVVIVEL